MLNYFKKNKMKLNEEENNMKHIELINKKKETLANRMFLLARTYVMQSENTDYVQW